MKNNLRKIAIIFLSINLNVFLVPTTYVLVEE